MNNYANLAREKIRSIINRENNRRELWLKSCCNKLYPTLSIEELSRIIKCMELTIYKDVDNDVEYLAYARDFVEGKHIDYIASFYK